MTTLARVRRQKPKSFITQCDGLHMGCDGNALIHGDVQQGRVSTAVAVRDLNNPAVGADIARGRSAAQGAICCDIEPCRTRDLAVGQRVVVSI